MTKRERLMATLEGRTVDRPAVSFYEIGGWKMAPDDDDFTVWNDPSWRPLVKLAHERTDIIRLMSPRWNRKEPDELDTLTTRKGRREGDSLFTRTKIGAPGRTLTSTTRRDRDIHTTWTLEHFLKSIEDVEAYLRLPEPSVGTVDVSELAAEEAKLGESGIVCVETADPICVAASLFSMEDYTVLAVTEQKLFHRLLERCARTLFSQCDQISSAFPGRMWRICGSEYASEPYLPPRLYKEYVSRYTGGIVKIIQKHGGCARMHSHGRLRGILPIIADMGIDALDPLEPPPQGDMTLREIKEMVGQKIVLMGNIEAADIENLRPEEFEKKVATAIEEGTAGSGRGFILHPSSCPYGRTITARTMANYRTMIRLVLGTSDRG